jgi:hypothetical protein
MLATPDSRKAASSIKSPSSNYSLSGWTGKIKGSKRSKRKEVPPYVLPQFPKLEVTIPDFNEDTPELMD